MSPKTKQKIWILYGTVMAVVWAVACGAIVLACLTIFGSPEGTFSRETVATAFARIAIPVWLAIGGVVAGIVLSFAVPCEEEKLKAVREESTILGKLTAGYDWSTLPPETVAAVERERILRRRLLWITVAVSLVLAIPLIVWILLPNSFGVEDKNREVMHAAAILAATFADVVITCMITGLISARSVHREHVLRKRAIAERQAQRRAEPAPRRQAPWDKPVILWSVRGCVIAVAIVFIVLGVSNGGMYDVLGKAIRICTECIGLG